MLYSCALQFVPQGVQIICGEFPDRKHLLCFNLNMMFILLYYLVLFKVEALR